MHDYSLTVTQLHKHGVCMLPYAKITSKSCVYTYPSSLHQSLNTYDYYIYFINRDTEVETLSRGPPASQQNEKSELSNMAMEADPHPRSQPGPS